jgi:hypothetical protein
MEGRREVADSGLRSKVWRCGGGAQGRQLWWIGEAER